MNILNASTGSFIAVVGGIAAVMTIVTLAPAGEPRPRFRTAPAAVEQTRIEVDKVANVIRFYIDGKQVAFVDSRGVAS